MLEENNAGSGKGLKTWNKMIIVYSIFWPFSKIYCKCYLHVFKKFYIIRISQWNDGEIKGWYQSKIISGVEKGNKNKMK